MPLKVPGVLECQSSLLWRDTMKRSQLTVSLPWLAVLRAAGSPGGGSFERIDSHVHIHHEALRFVESMGKTGWRALSICYSEATRPSDGSDLEMQLRDTAGLSSDSGGRIAWGGTFDARASESPDFPKRTMAVCANASRRGHRRKHLAQHGPASRR
jgi:hypothetical protein